MSMDSPGACKESNSGKGRLVSKDKGYKIKEKVANEERTKESKTELL